MKVIWAVLCQSAVIDKDTNNVSLLNVIEEVKVPAKPPAELTATDLNLISPATFELVTLWTRSDPGAEERGRAHEPAVWRG